MIGKEIFTFSDTEVYRLEYPDGNGPWNSAIKNWHLLSQGERVEFYIFLNKAAYGISGAKIEFGSSMTLSHFCAYPGLDSLVRFWKKEFLLLFLKTGGKLYKIKVKEAICTEDQCIYHINDIIFKSEFNINLIWG